MRPLLALLLLAGCADDSVVEVGVIEYYNTLDEVLEAPATARAGEPVPLRVLTYGNSCIDPVYLDVEATDSTVTLTPYDRRPTDLPCNDDLTQHPHDADVTFPTAGTHTIIVRGRRLDGRGDVLIEQTHTIDIE